MFFSPDDRARARTWVLDRARRDERILAGAVVGSEAAGRVDRFSDLDLTFGVRDGVRLGDVLDDWTRDLERDLSAMHLFDLPFLSSLYRVFLLPGCLQLDVSVTPQAEFGALGPTFQLLFGTSIERVRPPPASTRHLFGLAVHHAVRARFCVERKKVWQAEHWIHALREEAMTLACRRLGLESAHGRGYDALPPEMLAHLEGAIVRSFDRSELLRALGVAVDALLREADAARDLATALETSLRDLSRA